MLLQLERRKQECVDKLKTYADKESWSDGETKEVDALKSDLRKVQSELEQRKFIDELDKRDAASKEPAQTTDFDNMQRRFSLSKAVASMAGNTQVDAGLEREVSDELAQRSQRKTDGIFMPTETLLAKRTQLTATTGDITEDNYAPQELAYPLQNALVTSQLGARVITGLQGRSDFKIPMQDTSGASGWYAEDAAITSGDLTFSQRTASMKSLGAIRGWSRQAALQATPEIESIMRRDLVEVLAQQMDEAAIKGGGTNEPSGVMASVTATNRAESTNGKALTSEEIAALPTKLNVANIPATSRAFLTSEHIVAKNKMTQLFTNGDRTVYQNGQLLEERTVVSNLSALTTGSKGSGRNLRALIYGNWSELYILFWAQIELLLNPYGTGYDKGIVQLRATVDASTMVRRTNAFAYYNDIIQA